MKLKYTRPGENHVYAVEWADDTILVWNFKKRRWDKFKLEKEKNRP